MSAEARTPRLVNGGPSFSVHIGGTQAVHRRGGSTRPDSQVGRAGGGAPGRPAYGQRTAESGMGDPAAVMERGWSHLADGIVVRGRQLEVRLSLEKYVGDCHQEPSPIACQHANQGLDARLHADSWRRGEQGMVRDTSVAFSSGMGSNRDFTSIFRCISWVT